MAEAFLQKYGGNEFNMYSAGLEPTAISPFTVKVLGEVGIDSSAQYAKPLETYLGKVYLSYIITDCSNAEERCPIFPGMGERLH